MNDSVREGRPTCLIVDPARRFGGKTDRSFSDLTARAFWRAGWNVVWVVDRDDTLDDRAYADVRRILPATPLMAEARAASTSDDEPLPLDEYEFPNTVAAPTVKVLNVPERVVPASAPPRSLVAKLDDWARSTWRNSHAIAPRLAAVALWATIRVWYGVACARWPVGRQAARMSRWLYWQICRWSAGLQWAAIHTIHFLGWRATRRPHWMAGTDGATKKGGKSAPTGLYGPDFCSLIRQCGPRDVVVMPAAEMTLIESLFDLIAKLQLERPLPTTLHVRFASVERMQAPGGGVDSATLGARLKSGSPFRNVFMRCDDLDRAAHTAHDLRIAVHALADVRESATDALLLHQLSPYASTVGEPCDLAPSVSAE